MQLGKSTLISCNDVTATGASEVNGTAIDMQNYEGVVFVVKLETAAPDNTVKLQVAEQEDLSDAVDLADTETASDGTSTTIIIDIHKPNSRFVRPVVTRGTATAIQSITAIQYCPRCLPTDSGGSDDVTFSAFVSPPSV